MQNESSGLTRLQERAIEGLLTTPTRAEAAKAAGCSERALYKWLGQPGFRSELLERENGLRREVGRRLAQGANQALDLLKKFINDQNADARLRLRAADLWLSYLIKTQEFSELEARVTDLERIYQDSE